MGAVILYMSTRALHGAGFRPQPSAQPMTHGPDWVKNKWLGTGSGWAWAFFFLGRAGLGSIVVTFSGHGPGMG